MSAARRRTSAAALATIALVALTGASRVDEKHATYTSKVGQFSVTLPVGWVMADSKSSVTVSRDGFALNSISIARVSLTEAFKQQLKEQRGDAKGKPQGSSKVALDPTTSPEDLAALQIAERKRANEATEVIANDPATVAGFPAFKVTTELKDERGLRTRLACYGFVNESGLFRGCYSAPTLYYYERDLPAFEATIASLAYLPPKQQRKRR